MEETVMLGDRALTLLGMDRRIQEIHASHHESREDIALTPKTTTARRHIDRPILASRIWAAIVRESQQGREAPSRHLQPVDWSSGHSQAAVRNWMCASACFLLARFEAYLRLAR